MSWIHFPPLSIEDRHRQLFLQALGLYRLKFQYADFRDSTCLQSLSVEGDVIRSRFPTLKLDSDFLGWGMKGTGLSVETYSPAETRSLWDLLTPHPWNKLSRNATFFPPSLEQHLCALVDAVNSWERFAETREFTLIEIRRGAGVIQLFLHYVRGKRLRMGFVDSLDEALPISLENAQEVKVPADVGRLSLHLSDEPSLPEHIQDLSRQLRFQPAHRPAQEVELTL